MYIQITERCNMSCAHCCMRATATGRDMDRQVFLAAMGIAEDYGMAVTIGGGEPTLHAKLFDFIGLALAYADECKPCVITNGKLKKPALRLARMGKEGMLSAELSIDQYHERVSPEVQTAFTRDDRYRFERNYNDLRGIRTVTQILHMGRAADNEVSTNMGCACDDLFVDPDGVLWSCAHKLDQCGDVFTPDIPQDLAEYSCALKRQEHKEQEDEEELLQVA